MGFLMPPHPLTNFEIQKYYENEPRFNGVYSWDNLPKEIKDGAYVINLDEHADTGTHWIALFCMKDEVIYFDSFGVEHIPKEIKHKSIHLLCTSKWFSNVWILLHWLIILLCFLLMILIGTIK